MTRIAIIESPFSGRHGALNIELARNICRIAYKSGYNPLASHLFYTQFMDDDDPTEREDGIRFGLEIAARCGSSVTVWMVLRTDENITPGMLAALTEHFARGRTIAYFRTSDNGKHITQVNSFVKTSEL